MSDNVLNAIRRLPPGTVVGHANPELSGWQGTVTANRGGQYRRVDTGDVWVTWHAGNVQRRDGNRGLPVTGWIEATALTIAGKCPDCGQPAHYVLAGNFWDRPEGWSHDAAPEEGGA